MKQLDVNEAAAQLSRLVDEVAAGERVVIARDGEPIAVLMPYSATVRRLGLFAGEATIHADFDEPEIAVGFGEP